MQRLPRPRIEPRDAAGRLLTRRPDLGASRAQRRRARQLVEGLGCSAAATDVLAGWLGAHHDSDVTDLELALSDRLQLRLAGLAPHERPGADRPEARAADAIGLGWEQLLGSEGQDAVRLVALGHGQPMPRATIELAAAGDGVVAALAAGFLDQPQEGGGLWAQPELLTVVPPQEPAEATERAMRLATASLETLAGATPPPDEVLDLVVASVAGQPLLQATLRHRASEARRRAGEYASARTHQFKGQDALDHEGPAAAALRALLLMDTGLVELEEGALSAAQHAFEGAIESLEDAEAEEGVELLRLQLRLYRAQAMALGSSALQAEGELVAALEGLVVLSEGTPAGPLAANLALGRMTLGHLLLGRGQVSAAVRLLQEAWEDWEDLELANDPRGAAFALALSQGLRAAGRSTEVEEPLELARVLSGGDMDRPMRRTLPMALHDLGVAAADRRDWTAASTLVDEASMMAMSLLPRHHPDRARFAYTRGLLFLAQGDAGAARRQLEKADDLLGPGEAPGIRPLIQAALAWARSREGAHRHDGAASDLSAAELALAALRGEESNAVGHLRILRESLDARPE